MFNFFPLAGGHFSYGGRYATDKRPLLFPLLGLPSAKVGRGNDRLGNLCAPVFLFDGGNSCSSFDHKDPNTMASNKAGPGGKLAQGPVLTIGPIKDIDRKLAGAGNCPALG